MVRIALFVWLGKAPKGKNDGDINIGNTGFVLPCSSLVMLHDVRFHDSGYGNVCRETIVALWLRVPSRKQRFAETVACYGPVGEEQRKAANSAQQKAKSAMFPVRAAIARADRLYLA